jgi:hypothetical protein
MNTKEEKTRYIQTRDGEYEAQEQDKGQFAQRRMINGCAASPSIAGWDPANHEPTTKDRHRTHGIHQWRERKVINKNERPEGKNQDLIIKEHHIIPMYIIGRGTGKCPSRLLHILVE